MNNLKLVVVRGEPNVKDKKVLVKGMLSYHTAKGHPRKSETFSIFIKDRDQKVWGGIIVSYLWNGMEIQTLWVDESLRNQGWGQKLLLAAETEAVKRGCTISYTNTFSWQAPEFYLKLGYTQYGKLDGFPEGSCLSYLRKKLI